MKYIRNFLLAILSIAVIFIAGCLHREDRVIAVPPENSIPSINQKCKDFARIAVREYLLDNNVWGKGDSSDYRQCIWADATSNPLKAGWSWSWGEESKKKVKAYPEIHYGWDWDKSFTTTKLPLKVNKIDKIQAKYDVSTSAKGLYNLAFDLWLTKAEFPTRNNLSREIMIWVDKTQKHSIDSTLVGRFTIDSDEYDLFINHDWNYWTYFAFIKVVPQVKGVLNIHEFLFFLKKAGYISPKESLVEIEIGNEIWAGKGETVVNSYSINVND